MQKILLRLAERVSIGAIVKRNSQLDQEYSIFERKVEKNNDDNDLLEELYDYDLRFNTNNKRDESHASKNKVAHLIAREITKSNYYYLYILNIVGATDDVVEESFDGHNIFYNDFIHQLNVKLKYNRNSEVKYCLAQVYF